MSDSHELKPIKNINTDAADIIQEFNEFVDQAQKLDINLNDSKTYRDGFYQGIRSLQTRYLNRTNGVKGRE